MGMKTNEQNVTGMERHEERHWIFSQPVLMQFLLLPTIFTYLKLDATKTKRIVRAFFFYVSVIYLLTIIFISLNTGQLEVLLFSLLLFWTPYGFSLSYGLLMASVFALPFILGLWGLYEFGHDVYIYLRSGGWTPYFLSEWIYIEKFLSDHSDWVGLKKVLFHVADWTPNWLLIGVSSQVAYLGWFLIDDYFTPLEKQFRSHLETLQNPLPSTSDPKSK